MSYVSSLTIRIPEPLRRELKKLSRQKQQSLSDIVRESLRRYVAAEQLRNLRTVTHPRAQERGFLTDEKVFKAVS